MTDPITPLTPEEVAQTKQQVAAESYLRREVVDVDIFAGETAGGPTGETISARAGRAALKGKWWGIVLCKFLNLFEKNHCAKAIAAAAGRAENIEKIEDSSGAL